MHHTLIGSFVEYLKVEKNYSQRTIDAYQRDLEQFYSFTTSHSSITHWREIAYKHVRSWIICLISEGISPRSVNRKVSTLKSFTKFLVKTGEIEHNPLLGHQPIKSEKSIQINYSQEELLRLKDHLSLDDFESSRDYLIFYLSYGLGLRRAELIDLTINDISMSNRHIKVHGKGNKERVIPFSEEFKNVINCYLDFRSDNFGLLNEFLLLTNRGVKLYENFVYRKIKSYLSLVTTKNKKSPHLLRHSFATHMLDNGSELNTIKELLGHSSLAATQHYLQSGTAKLKSVYKGAHPREQKK